MTDNRNNDRNPTDVWNRFETVNDAMDYQMARKVDGINNTIKQLNQEVVKMCDSVTEFGNSAGSLNANVSPLLEKLSGSLSKCANAITKITEKISDYTNSFQSSKNKYVEEVNSLVVEVQRQMMDANNSQDALISHVLENGGEIVTIQTNNQMVLGGSITRQPLNLNPISPKIQTVGPPLTPRGKPKE